MPNVSGRTISARADFVRERFGVDAWQTIVDRLTEPLRATLAQPVDPTGWYPIEVYAQIQRAVASAFGGGDGSGLLEQLGAFAAEKNAGALYGSFGRDPFEFFKDLEKLHLQTFDFGKMTVVRRPGGCIVEIDF